MGFYRYEWAFFTTVTGESLSVQLPAVSSQLQQEWRFDHKLSTLLNGQLDWNGEDISRYDRQITRIKENRATTFSHRRYFGHWSIRWLKCFTLETAIFILLLIWSICAVVTCRLSRLLSWNSIKEVNSSLLDSILITLISRFLFSQGLIQSFLMSCNQLSQHSPRKVTQHHLRGVYFSRQLYWHQKGLPNGTVEPGDRELIYLCEGWINECGYCRIFVPAPSG